MTTDFDGEFDHANAVAIQADGKIVAAGFGYRDTDPDDDQEIIRVDFFLARYNPDGSRDTTFGNSGGLFTTFEEGESEAYGVALQGDGKIVAAGLVGLGLSDFAWPGTTATVPSTPPSTATGR